MWTDEQKLAIEKSGTNILISAGAGSGKTTVLTERIIKKIISGVSLKELIILTFTNAASKSMKRKIKEAIIKQIEEGKNKECFLKELAYIDQANISTFDSFTMALVSKYAHILHISENISIIEETQKVLITKQLFEEVFQELLDEEETNFLEMLDKYTIRDYNALIDAFNTLYNKELANIVDLDSYLDNYLDNYQKNMEKAIIDYEKLIIKEKKEVDQIAYELEEDGKVIYDDLLKKGLKEFLEANDLKDFKTIAKINFRTVNTKDEEIKKAKEKFSEAYKAFYNKQIYTTEECHKAYLEQFNSQKSLVEILKRFKKKYDNYIKKTNSFSYNDISILAISLLKNNPKIKEEIVNNTKEILVDEYQDTSDLQEELINLLSNNNCYMVGDIKQSIYRFRNANPSIFQRKFDDYGHNNGGIRIDLTKNFRSRKEVLDDINEMFVDVMSNDFGGIDYYNEHMLQNGNQNFVGNIPCGIEFYVHTNRIEYDKDNKAIKKTLREKVIDKVLDFKEILASIMSKMKTETVSEKGKLRKPTFKDFTILTRNRTDYALYDAIAKEENIPLQVEHELPFARNEEIFVLTSIFSYLRDSDLLSYFSILRSFLYNMNDEELLIRRKEENYEHEALNILQEIKKEMQNYSLDGLIQLIYEKFHFYEKIHLLYDSANVELRLIYILNTSKIYAKQGFDFNYLLDYLKQIQTKRIGNKDMDISFKNVEKTDNNAISMMTIHKSKGLEFPFCYIINTNSDIGKIDNQNFFNYSNKYGITFKPFACDYFLNYLINKQNKILQLYEDSRILYVALTRAMEKAVIYLDEYDGNLLKEKRSISLYEKENFKTFNDMISLGYEGLNVSSNLVLEKQYVEKEAIDKGEVIQFKNYASKVEKEEKKIASITINRLLSSEEKNALEYGTKLHKILENLDFFHPDIKEEKEIVMKFLKQDFFNKKIIQVYKELEFIFENTQGIIDLILETDEELIIIDYKANDINKVEYLEQVKTYIKYLSTVSKKKISGYLYSLIQGIKREVE